MKCSFCDKKAIYFDGTHAYCKEHFIQYFENKVIDTIESFNLIKSGETIGVGVSGGKDSLSLMYFLNKYSEYFGIKVIGIHIDEGIHGYRDVLTKYLLDLAKKHDWDIRVYRFKDYFRFTLDEAVKLSKDLKPCTICGVWRRWLLHKAAEELKVDKIATGHNINDEVQTIFMNLFDGNIKDFVKGGPYVGVSKEFFIPRIKPFYLVTEKETTIYALLNNINPPWNECPYIYGQTRDIVRRDLYQIESKYPGFHRNIINWYINTLLELKPKYKETHELKLKKCKICGYPTSRDICRACEIKLKLLKERTIKDNMLK